MSDNRFMEVEKLIHRCLIEVSGLDYEVLVYTRPDGTHVAKTSFSPEDVIINDGLSLDEVLRKHRSLLPLAVVSREILRQFRTSPD